MRVVRINPKAPDRGTLEEAAGLVVKGDAVVYPTDTAYGLAVDALSEEAIRKLFRIKGRPSNRPVHIIVGNMAQAERYGYLDERARKLAQRFFPGPLTIVVPRRPVIPALLVAGGDTVGIRIPDNVVAVGLAQAARCPLTATSANVSDMETAYSIQDVLAQFEGRREQPALLLDQGPLQNEGVSTVVDVTLDSPRVLRQGRIAEKDIFAALGLLS